jgi:hypothetical protein
VRWGEVRLPVQGGQSCCFSPGSSCVAFQLQLCWSVLPLAKCGNSVLNAVFFPRDHLQDPPPALLWEVGLLSHLCSHLLCFSQSLLCASGSFGRLTCHPTTTLSLYAYPDLCWVPIAPLGCFLVTLLPISAFVALPVLDHWEFGAEGLAPCRIPILLGRFRVPPPSLLSVFYYSLLGFFQFCWEVGFSLSRACTGLFPMACVGSHVWWVMLTCFAVSCKQLWSQLAKRNGPLFSVWCGIGRLFTG